MNDLTDQQLLRDYAERQSETAFAEIVRRRVDLVYSAALRMVCDPHLAEDVTQAVFLALAQNSRQLTDRPVLSGWLHRTAQNIASKSVRTEVRRRAREQEAVAMNELLAHESDAAWENIAPHLDTALGELSEPDRDALLLRYFERKSAREMAQTLGTSEEAAQKRVNRAVERLREFFSKRNVTVGANGFVVLISANAVQAAPVGMFATISSAVTTATFTIATHTTMHWLNLKSVAAILAAAIAAGTGTHLVQQREANQLRSENQKLKVQQKHLTAERDTALASASEKNDEMEQSRKDKNELLRLRGEVGVLRKQASELASLKEKIPRLHTTGSIDHHPPQASAGPQTDFPSESWAFAGYATPEAAFQSWTWAMSKGDKQTMFGSLVPDERIKWEKMFVNEPESDLIREGGKIQGYKVINREVRSDSEVDLTISTELRIGRTNKMKMSLQKLEGDWKIVGPAKNQ